MEIIPDLFTHQLIMNIKALFMIRTFATIKHYNHELSNF